jgi:hypothetical protein
MILVDTLGCIPFIVRVMSLEFFKNLKIMLNAFSRKKFVQSNLIGVVNIIPFTHSFNLSVSPIMSLAHAHINKMAKLNANIDTLSKQA